MRRPSRPATYCGTGLLFTAVFMSSALGGEALDQKVENASRLRHHRKYKEALAACEAIFKNEKATEKNQVQTFEIVNDVHRRMRKHGDAVKAGKRIRAMFPGNKALERSTLFAMSDNYRDMRKYPQGLELMKELLEKQGDNKKVAAAAHHRMGWLYAHSRKRQEAYDHGTQAVELDPEHAWRVADSLHVMQDSAWHLGKMDLCFQALKRLMQPDYRKHRRSHEYQNHWRRMGDALMRMKKVEEARAHYSSLEKEVEDIGFRQECALRIAGTHKGDAGLQAYERVITDYPKTARHWYSAQTGIVRILREQTKFKEALSAARILLDASGAGRTIADRVREMAELFLNLDKNAGRANAFIAYQKGGPAGKDGKPGTPDDIKNPLKGIPYPKYPGRAKAFAEVRGSGADSAGSFRHLGLTYIYTGEPKKAVRAFAEAFRRCSGKAIQSTADSLIFLGVRANEGHPANLGRYYAYLNYGPNGPDAKPKTADDIADPFAALLK